MAIWSFVDRCVLSLLFVLFSQVCSGVKHLSVRENDLELVRF